MDVTREYWMRVTMTAAVVVAVAAKAPGTLHISLHIKQTRVTDVSTVEKEFVTDINMAEEEPINLYVNHTQVMDISITEGKSVSIIFIANLPPPHTNTYFLIEEHSPDGISHVMVVPPVVKAKISMNFTTEPKVMGTFNLIGTLLGFTNITISLVTGQGGTLLTSRPYTIKVQRIHSFLEKIFSRCLLAVITVVYINMGCTLDTAGVIDTLRKPFAPVIGLFLQYLLMPMVSYGIGYTLFREQPALWFGMLIVGSCPGGGGSNTWTHLLNGTLHVSVTMTFTSMVVAFIALPLWFYLLGDTIFQSGIKLLPYGEMAGLMFGIVLPCAVGISISHLLPRVANILRSLLTPAVVFFVLFATTLSVVTNLYIFELFTWKVAVAGMALPWAGFGFGAAAGLVCRRPWQEVMTIAIESGIQNTGLAISIIKVVLEGWSPLGELIVVIAMAVSLLTLPPLLVALVTKISLPYCTTTHPYEDTDGVNLSEKPATIKTPLCPTKYQPTS
ncbi:sodium/bile acid cotransporter 5-like isoform X2 [Scylla paramamosain]